jgi:hypothetical protein
MAPQSAPLAMSPACNPVISRARAGYLLIAKG